MPDFKVKVKETKAQKTDLDQRFSVWEERAGRLDKWIGKKLYVLIGLVILGMAAGTPHLLIQYHCSFAPCKPERAYACDYLGYQGWKTEEAGTKGCDYVKLF